MICNVCGGTGFKNLHQIPDKQIDIFLNTTGNFINVILAWISSNDNHDVQVCDCCGDGNNKWYGEPGSHYSDDDPIGNDGPYAYNGGLSECD